MTANTDEVLFEEIATAGGKRIGVATLNAPKALNSLSLDMILTLRPQLEAWDADDDIGCIWLEGAGDKAFCAGGDVVAIYKGITGEGDPDYPRKFFENEYRLDYAIHRLTTPTIAWGDGIVMGGGLGILAGASHRVATENTRMAMPEITIGLFPDVGATWFLNRMPGRTGLFLGLTGANINAGDARLLGLANRYANAEHREEALDRLAAVKDWGDPEVVTNRVMRDVERLSGKAPGSHLRKHFDLIDRVTDYDTLAGVVAGIRELEAEDDKWLVKAAQTSKGGCPVTAHLVYEQIRRGAHLSLKQCFMRELKMAVQCSGHADFPEGVRALLVDKDGKPHWRYGSVAEVPHEVVEEHFAAPWDGEHPLADLPEETA